MGLFFFQGPKTFFCNCFSSKFYFGNIFGIRVFKKDNQELSKRKNKIHNKRELGTLFITW